MSDVLVDKVAAFTFSRKPRAERIAATLKQVLINQGYLKTFSDGSGNMQFDEVPEITDATLVEIGKELAPYAAKDFAVRFGKLETDIAPTKNFG